MYIGTKDGALSKCLCQYLLHMYIISALRMQLYYMALQWGIVYANPPISGCVYEPGILFM